MFPLIIFGISYIVFMIFIVALIIDERGFETELREEFREKYDLSEEELDELFKDEE